MIDRVYKWLWTRIGGRPWSYIIQDSLRKYPLFWLLLFGAIGMLLGHIFW